MQIVQMQSLEGWPGSTLPWCLASQRTLTGHRPQVSIEANDHITADAACMPAELFDPKVCEFSLGSEGIQHCEERWCARPWCTEPSADPCCDCSPDAVQGRP